ncbi:hypothetical protein ES711_08670 [Gelidibacter salicanalis]|uniref:GIY-YIG domain-containing protein n=1 Tax=Gelidibacter salicanalis TaxID=291193 RepID=A0A5C7APU1_9FLAO|nr:hypothetical protein [Gelidibacter salicanalis]TXE08565.1 hypothetical protein ES711_08670 [Gelidibacter salicanalis]
MNVWEDPYTESLNDLLEESKSISIKLKTRLNAIDCPTINELYLEKNSRYHIQKKLFNEFGYLPNSRLYPNKDILNEFKGLYVFGEKSEDSVLPMYLGISRTIYRRLRQHGFGKKHNECTLAYILANHENFESKFNLGRAQLPTDLLSMERERVRNFKVALYPVESNYELYFHEVAIAGLLKTKFNKFKTH